MSVELICETSTEVTYQVTISLRGSMLEAEEAIQQKLNEIGLAATQKKLEAFDTDGSPIVVGNKKFTRKARRSKTTRRFTASRPSNVTSTNRTKAARRSVRSTIARESSCMRLLCSRKSFRSSTPKTGPTPCSRI